MSVSGRVLLGLEEGIKVPEGALNEVVSRHLCEAVCMCVCMCVCVCVYACDV